MAIAITAGKIHLAIDTIGIRKQCLLDNAHRLDKPAPVHYAQKPETADTVANGDLIGSFLPVSRLHQLLNSHARFNELLLNPVQRQCQSGTASLQLAHKFRNKRLGHRRVRACHVCNYQNQIFGILLCAFDHLPGPEKSEVPVTSARGNTDCDVMDICDQGQTHHDGNRP